VNAQEYLFRVRRRNEKLFTYRGEKKLTISTAELERVIVEAFNEGKQAGVQEGKNSKSFFEQIFG